MKKKVLCYGFSFLLVAALALALVSCGEVAQAEEQEVGKMQFAFVSHYGPESEWEANVLRGWNEAMKTLGAEVEGKAYFGEGDHTKTMDLIETAIVKGVDGLLVLSYDLEGTTPLLREGLAKGIAIVTAAMRAPGFTPQEIPSTGLDYEAQGYISGVYNAAQYKAAGLLNDVNIAFFAEMIAEYSVERRLGMLRALDDAGIKYIAEDIFETTMDMTKNIDMIKSYLMTHTEIDAIVCLGSVSTPAGAVVLKDLGYKPGKVQWTGYDLSPQGVAGIRAGYGCINVDENFNHGFYGAMMLYEKVKYGLSIGHLPIFSVMVDKDNIDKFVD